MAAQAPKTGGFPEKGVTATFPGRNGPWKRRRLRKATRPPKTCDFPEKPLRPPFPAATALENGGF